MHVWELHTSARVCVLRQCGCRGRQQVALAAGGACLAAAQPDKPAVHLFWGAKEQAVYRCPCPEIMTCCLFGAQDTLLFAGGQSGCLYVWEVRSLRTRIDLRASSSLSHGAHVGGGHRMTRSEGEFCPRFFVDTHTHIYIHIFIYTTYPTHSHTCV